MNATQRRSDRFLYAVLIFCIFSFKVIALGVNASGVRVDDPIILLAFLVLLFRGDLLSVKRSRAFNLYLVFICVSFFSTVWNVWNGRVEWLYSTLFVVRLLQYIVFYYIGHTVERMGADLARVLRVYVVVLCAVVPLQALHILPSPNAFDQSMRASGNTNGPYEMATVTAFLLCYLGYRNKERLYGAVSFVLIILTGARSTFVGVAISLAKVMTRGRRRRVVLVAAGVFAGIALLGGYGAILTSGATADPKGNVMQRLSAATDLVNVDVVTIYENTPTYRTTDEYISGAFIYAIPLSGEAGGDPSAMQRVFRWTALIKSALANVDTTLIGLGPSFGTSAVDGYFVRAFVETGVVGLGLFLWFVWALMSPKGHSPWQFREYVFIMLVTAISIDIFVSYKPMLILWLWHGMNEYQVAEGTDANSLPDAC
jgi:hypothetical protein